MKITPTCAPCLLKRCIYEAKLSSPDTVEEAVRAAAIKLGELYDEALSSAHIATQVHRAVYDVLGTDDPYRGEKMRSNEVAMSLLPRARDFMGSSPEPLRAAALVAVLGNVLDFGIDASIQGPEALSGVFDSLLDEGLGVDELDRAMALLPPKASVLYFTDNCGEIVFDVLLVEELRRRGCRVSGVVKGVPILTDATLEDARTTGFADAVDELLATPSFYVGVEVDAVSGRLKELIGSADLLICKGMANFEAFSETGITPVLYLLRSKCGPVASALGVPGGVNVAKLVQ